MGLDMYAFKVEPTEKDTDFKIGNQHLTELMYWRKHHDLHGWMYRLYLKKGGVEPEGSFNTIPVRLTLEDRQQLREDILNHNLPATKGFFFGNYPPTPDTDERDLRFVEDAEQAIKNGYSVYYDSWW